MISGGKMRKPYEVEIITFENLYRKYFLYARSEEDAICEVKKIYKDLSEVLSVKKIEVK